MPSLARYVTERADKLTELEYGLTVRDVDKPAQAAMLKMMAASSRDNYRLQGHATQHWSDSEALSAIPPAAAEAFFSTLQQQYIFNLNFEAFGRKTFYFHHSLSELLAETELNVNCEDFTLPFNACMFVYDSQFMRDALYAMNDNAQEVPQAGAITVYASIYNDNETGRGLVIAAMLPKSDGVVRFMIRRQLRMSFGTTLEDALRTEWSNDRVGNTFELANIVDDSQFFGPGLAFIRAVVNSALYLTSADPDISDMLHPRKLENLGNLPRRQRVRTEHEVGQRSALSYVDVGENIVRLPDPEAPEQEGRKLTARVKVRSHWKWQAHGTGRTERKRIQVMPYWRGPDAAEIIHRPFVVRGRPDGTDEESEPRPGL